MDITYFVYGFILLCLAVMGAYRLDVEGVNTASRTPWWKNSVGPFGEGLEGFEPVPQGGPLPQGSRREREGFVPVPQGGPLPQGSRREREGFVPVPQGSRREPEDSSPLLDFPPGKPAPADIFTPSPYHLLGDRLPPALDEQEKGALSCVNSRSCYATDAEAMLSRVGNYRQMTNQYKREYPDSCSALRQELVLGFYKATPLTASS